MKEFGFWFNDNKKSEVLERIKLAHERFQRRMPKRTIEFRKAERKGGHGRIPGAWID